MSLFKKPTRDDRRLKLYVYGEAGSGKTITSLFFPSPAVVDCDGGTDFYTDKFDFVRIKSTSIDEINKAVDELIADPTGIKTFVLDGMSNYWDLLQDKHLKRLRVKNANPNYILKPVDYKMIQADLKSFIHKLLALDLNIVVTAKSKNEYSADTTEFMKVIGKKPDGPKEVPYLFDVVLELTVMPDERRLAKVIKDRTNTLPKEFEYSYQELIKYIDMEELNRDPVQLRAVQRLEKGANRTTSITLDGQVVMTAGISAETLSQIKVFIPKFDEIELKAKLTEDYFVSSILDLKEDEARQFLADLQTKING
jgi:hypothetical protein